MQSLKMQKQVSEGGTQKGRRTMLQVSSPQLPRCSVFLFSAFCFLFFTVSCRPTRIEHHRRPAFFEKASTQKLEREVVLEDGTVLKFHSTQGSGIAGLKGSDGSKPFLIREEDDKGNITLRALLPEHVLINTLACIRNQEYQLMWEQLLAERTRLDYQEHGGFEAFASFLAKNRHDLVATLNRMVAGIPSQEVSFTRIDDAVTRCRLRPQIAEGFRFKIVDVAKEMGELKLGTIQ